MIDLVADDDGLLLPLQAHPRAKKNGVVGVHAGRLKVAVTAAPERGKANDAIVKLLAKLLGLKRSQVKLAAGETSREKTLRVTGVDEAALRERINALLDG